VTAALADHVPLAGADLTLAITLMSIFAGSLAAGLAAFAESECDSAATPLS